jgi:hypothetical protein
MYVLLFAMLIRGSEDRVNSFKFRVLSFKLSFEF